MNRGIIRIYYGEGRGKSAAAFGTAVMEAASGKTVTIISFLRKKNEACEALIKQMEPELKFFRLEKSAESFHSLSIEEKEEEMMNLRNGFNYSKKVITTCGCDLVILDEILDLIEDDIVSEKAFLEIVPLIPEGMIVICTGRHLRSSIRDMANEIYEITPEK